MTITYNDNKYDVTSDSVYSDFSIKADSLADACKIIEAFGAEKTAEYTFGINVHSNMVVVKRIISVTDTGITVRIKLRRKSDSEAIYEELTSLRQAMADLAETANKTTTDKINNLLNKGVM